jgi:hypothetical protein
MNTLIAMLSEDGTHESVSTMRVASLLTVVLILGTWATVSVQKGALQPLSVELAALVPAVLGLKAWQRKNESPAPTAGPSPA